jgi:protein-S-isoprenylcysteine O-methyltransferase Ste14
MSTFLAGYVPIHVRLILAGHSVPIAVYLARSGHAAVAEGRRFGGVLTTGAFRYVRHPLYLASLIVYLTLTVSTMSLLSLAVFVAAFVFYDHIAGYEEKLMIGKFGGEYESYIKKTGKWIPGVGRG